MASGSADDSKNIGNFVERILFNFLICISAYKVLCQDFDDALILNIIF